MRRQKKKRAKALPLQNENHQRKRSPQPAPVPPAGEKEMRKHLRVWGEKPQRVQGSALPPAA
ncbi:hypothetical protein D7X33_09585 [Butyricicoccus sp. 1XD8-22]|nr:hypothetical protein D7X33_09585 [Butyricicoccus sp. 1XD8-22]